MRLGTISLVAASLFSASPCNAQPYFVSPTGGDANPGTLEMPFATLQRAQTAVRENRGNVFQHGGIHHAKAPA